VSVPTSDPVIAKTAKLRWPTTVVGWLGLTCLVAADVWLAYTRQDAVVLILTGYIFNQMGMDAKQSATLTTVVAAVGHSIRAADAADRAADAAVETAVKADEKLNTIEAGIKDIQDNPAMPGTPAGRRTA
jgi:hypothetical protein